MCRMLAKVSSKPTGIIQELEHCPNSLLWLSENGRKSHNPDVRGRHNDGCGMAYIDNDGTLKATKHGKKDFWNNSYHDFAEQALSKLYIAHNRFASEGLETSINGAHPFIINKFGEQLAFCHNGGIDTFMDEARARNTSDSEVFFEHLVEKLPELSSGAIVNSVSVIATQTDFSSLCGFLLSKKELYIWRIFNEKRKADFDKLSRYFTLYFSIRKNFILIASEPIDNESWQLLPNNKMLTLTPYPDEIEMRLADLSY